MKIQSAQIRGYSPSVDTDENLLSKGKARLLGFLSVGLGRDPAAETKYGLFLDALARRFDLIGMYDVSLRGYRRLWAGVLNFHPNQRVWKERYYKNIYSFRERSRSAAYIQNCYKEQADLVFQVGVLFDAYWDKLRIPNVIYTDWTARLSAESTYRFRSPLRGANLSRWLDCESRAFHRAAHIFTRSEFVRQDIVQHYGIPLEKVSVVGGGVNLDPFPAPPTPRQIDSLLVLFIGSEFKRKGGDVLLRAFSLVRNRIPKARLRLLTRDSIPADLPMENVEIVPYVWDRAKICRLYEEADLFVLPSREETWGDVLLEAAAYGLASISVRGSVMAEMIKDGETGLLTPLEDIDELATAMTTLLENTDLRLRLGERARLHVKSYFTWDHVVERMAPIIESIFSKTERRIKAHTNP